MEDEGLFFVSISFRSKCNEVKWVSSVYGPPRLKGRLAFWDELGDLFGLYNSCWCMVRDFNVIHSPLEKSSRGRVTRSMRSFNDFIEGCSLMDPP